jgi:hypothetical protein
MIEIIKHAFGFCGEGHPSLLYLCGIWPLLLGIKLYFNTCWCGIKKTCSKHACSIARHTQKLFL